MINKSIIISKRETITEALQVLKRKKKLSLEELQKDIDMIYAVLYAFTNAIQAIIDLGNHLCSEQNWGIAGTQSEIIIKLVEHQVIPKDKEIIYIQMIGFRNIIVHEYKKIDISKVYSLLQDHLDDIEMFITYVEKYLY